MEAKGGGDLEAGLQKQIAEEAKGAPPAPEANPLTKKADALQKSAENATGALEQLKTEKLRSSEVQELRADPAAKKELSKIEARVDELARERAALKSELDGALDAARDPSIAGNKEIADVAAADIDRLQTKIDEINAEAKKVNEDLDTRIQDHQTKKAREAAEREAAERQAAEAFAREVGLQVDSPAVQNRHLTVDQFISEFRKASVRSEMPGEALPMTVEEALRAGDTTVHKLLTDGRFAK
jgi:hypothetical protein